MKDEQEVEAFYERLRNELETSTKWPSLYLFKFIIPSDQAKIDTIEGIFDNLGAVINKKTSSNQKYTSISIQVTMESPEEVILKYREVSRVEGVISL